MAEKKTCSLLAAKAVARVKMGKAFTGRWGAGEQLALHRYMAGDALQDAKTLVGKPVVATEPNGAKHTLETALNAILRDAYLQDPELAYASNFEKLLVKMGEIAKTNEYE